MSLDRLVKKKVKTSQSLHVEPTIIYPGKSKKLLDPNPQDMFPNCRPVKTDNGWIDTPTWRDWLVEVFVPAVKDKQKRVVLFVDGHSTHVTDEVHKIYKANNIIYYILHSHASHIIQLLDICYYKDLKSRWQDQVRSFKGLHKEMKKEISIYSRVSRCMGGCIFLTTNEIIFSGLRVISL